MEEPAFGNHRAGEIRGHLAYWREWSSLTGQTGVPIGISGKPLALHPLSSLHLSSPFLSPPPGRGSAGIEHPPAPRLNPAQPSPLSQRSAVGLAGVSPFPAPISSVGCARRGAATDLGPAALVLLCPSSSPSSIGDLFRRLGTKVAFPAAAGSCRLLPEHRVLLGTSSSPAQKGLFWLLCRVSSSSSLAGLPSEPIPPLAALTSSSPVGIAAHLGSFPAIKQKMPSSRLLYPLLPSLQGSDIPRNPHGWGFPSPARFLAAKGLSNRSVPATILLFPSRKAPGWQSWMLTGGEDAPVGFPGQRCFPGVPLLRR